jgi:hypothetical protein
MKTPSWAIAVGIMMILFGGCGALSDMQAIMSPAIFDGMEDVIEEAEKQEAERKKERAERDSLDLLEAQEDEIKDLDEEMKDNSDTTDNSVRTSVELGSGGFKVSVDEDEMDDMPPNIKEMLTISDYLKEWMVRLGWMGLFFSLLYVIGGVFMLVRKRFSLKLVYAALVLSILFAVFGIFIITNEGQNFLTMASVASAGFGIFIDIILLIIVTACDKTAYEPEAFP